MVVGKNRLVSWKTDGTEHSCKIRALLGVSKPEQICGVTAKEPIGLQAQTVSQNVICMKRLEQSLATFSAESTIFLKR